MTELVIHYRALAVCVVLARLVSVLATRYKYLCFLVLASLSLYAHCVLSVTSVCPIVYNGTTIENKTTPFG